MKSQSYMTRALRARDPRYANILGRLGYNRTDMQADAPKRKAKPNDLKTLRDEYQDKVGKRAYHGWDAVTLKAKIAEAKD